MSGVFFGKDIQPHQRRGARLRLWKWIPFADVEFVKCQHSYHFGYKKFDHLGVGRWFPDYVERDKCPESREERFRLRGLSSIEEARLECEKHAIKIGQLDHLGTLIGAGESDYVRHLSKAAKEKSLKLDGTSSSEYERMCPSCVSRPFAGKPHKLARMSCSQVAGAISLHTVCGRDKKLRASEKSA
jgi:hypothetical protein